MRQAQWMGLLFVLSMWIGCTEVKEVPATQLIVRVSAEQAVLAKLQTLRLRVAGPQPEQWALRNEKNYPADVLDWPVDLVLVPPSESQVQRSVEIIVEALDAAGTVLVQSRTLTTFLLRQTRLLAVSLTPCGTMPLGELCPGALDCLGQGCQSCFDGACSVTPVTNASDLPGLTSALDADVAPTTTPDAGETEVPASPDAGDTGERASPEAGATEDRPSPEAGAMDGAGDTSSSSDGSASSVEDAAVGCTAGFTETDGSCMDIDECMQSQNGGCPANATCKNRPGARDCLCATGLVDVRGDGSECVDPCAGACDPLATCTVVAGAARCSCPSTHTTPDNGKTCVLDSSCSLLNCDANATCQANATSRQCVCRAGYRGNGMSCSNIVECEETPTICGANSTCMDTVGSYVCGCQPDYRKTAGGCEKINDCAPTNPCQHGGSCSDGINKPICNCSGTGYDGPLCQNDIPDCTSTSCMNGGTCVEGVNKFTCTCPSGFMGDRCEAEICGDTLIRNATELQAARRCGEIRGYLQLAAVGAFDTGTADFPLLTKVTGELLIASSFNRGVTTPALTSVSFPKLQTIGGGLGLGGGALSGVPEEIREAHFPELRTTGQTFGVGLAVSFLFSLKTLTMPKLTKIGGDASFEGLPKLCTVKFPTSPAVTVTGNLQLHKLWNVPLGKLTLKSQGTLTQDQVGCCTPDSWGCDEPPETYSSYCGC